MTNEVTRLRQWRGGMKAWLAAVAIALAFAPVTAGAAWATTFLLSPATDTLSLDGLTVRAVLLGAFVPITLAAVGIPLTFAVAPRFGLRLVGEHETASIAIRRHLDRAAGRAARRQGIEIDVRVTGASVAEPVVVPGGTEVPTAPRPILAVPIRLGSLDDDQVDAVVTPVLFLARRRPIESRARLALQAPNLAMQGFWRTIRWQPALRLPLLAAMMTVTTLAAPRSGSLALLPVAGLLLAVSTAAAMAAMWILRPVWAKAVRLAADKTMGDPVAGITLPSWVIDLRDDDRDRPGGLGSTEATA